MMIEHADADQDDHQDRHPPRALDLAPRRPAACTGSTRATAAVAATRAVRGRARCARPAVVPFGVTRLPVVFLFGGATAGESTLASTADAAGAVPRVLVIDSYDSFVYNLVQYLGELGAEPEVVPQRRAHRRRGARPRARRRAAVARARADPRTPASSATRSPRSPSAAPRCSACASAIRRSATCSAARSSVRRDLMHGKTSHDRAPRARACSPACPSPLTATRYHSLVIDAGSRCPTASRSRPRTDDGIVMGVRHTDAAGRGCAVPPGEHPHRRRPRPAAQLPRHRRPRDACSAAPRHAGSGDRHAIAAVVVGRDRGASCVVGGGRGRRGGAWSVVVVGGSVVVVGGAVVVVVGGATARPTCEPHRRARVDLLPGRDALRDDPAVVRRRRSATLSGVTLAIRPLLVSSVRAGVLGQADERRDRDLLRARRTRSSVIAPPGLELAARRRLGADDDPGRRPTRSAPRSVRRPRSSSGSRLEQLARRGLRSGRRRSAPAACSGPPTSTIAIDRADLQRRLRRRLGADDRVAGSVRLLRRDALVDDEPGLLAGSARPLRASVRSRPARGPARASG